LWGERYWIDLIRKAPCVNNPVFVGRQNYPDEALFDIITSISIEKMIPVPELLRDFGRWIFPKLAQAYPVIFQGRSCAKEFLKTVESIIHVEVKKLYDEAYLPSLHCEEPNPGTLVMVYESCRKLCHLAEGLIRGVGEFYREEVAVTQETCMREGSRSCRIVINFLGPRS
jgi:hypothetical protein